MATGKAGGAVPFEAAGYAYVPGVFQYSAGVAALPGHRIDRIRFDGPVPLDEGFGRIGDILDRRGLPRRSLCACELRSPGQFSEDGFRAFNERYVETLDAWGCLDGGANPVARSNVCPAFGAPAEPSFHAFSFVVPDPDAGPSFVVAGGAECPEGRGNYRDHIVRRGDLSPDGLAEKVRSGLGERERRLAALGFAWRTRRPRRSTPSTTSIR